MKRNLMWGGVDISLPNVSYCEDVKDVHYTPYNLVRFYVGEITGTTPQTLKIYTDSSTSVDVQVSEENKWYSYVLPKDKGLFNIEGNSVKKVVVKANISYKPTARPPYYDYYSIIPSSTVEASFKGSNTSDVTDMDYMFKGCRGLTSLDLSNFNTSNVTSMTQMFISCRGLTSLDLRNFNTSNVTSMDDMFRYCNSLTSLNVSNFDTSNVTSMGQMFQNCNGLKSLDLSNFDTSKVIGMMLMFDNCSNLTSLNLSGWDTSKVTDMGGMFQNCSGLKSLDLSGWNTSSVTDMSMSSMFNGCDSLTTIRMVGCSEGTRTKIQNRLTKDNITGVTIVTK